MNCTALVGLLALLGVSAPAAALAQESENPSEIAVVAPNDGVSVGVERRIGEPEGNPRSGADLEQITEEVSEVLRCPVCQGMSVNDSPSESARAMKAEIQDLLANGYSERQVKSYFESTYGEFVLLDPKREGLNWLVWILPIAASLGGLAWVLMANRRRLAAEAEATEEGLDDYLEQVRAQVDRTEVESTQVESTQLESKSPGPS